MLKPGDIVEPMPFDALPLETLSHQGWPLEAEGQGGASQTDPSGAPLYASERWLERVDPRLKLVGMMCASLLAVALDQAMSLLILAGLGLMMLVLARLPRAQVRPLLGVLLAASWGTVFGQALFYDFFPRTVWVTIPLPFSWELPLYLEGMRYGLVQSLRFSALILLGTSLSLTTSPERMFLGLQHLRVPFGLSFMAVTAVRFLPLMLRELQTVWAVRRLRGYRRGRLGLRDLVRTEVDTFRPVVVKTLRRATDLATSLTLRAFDPAAERASLPPLHFSTVERLVLGGMVLATSSILLLKLLFLLYLHDWLYVSGMRDVYGWIRDVL